MNTSGTARQQDLRSLSDGDLCALLRGYPSESIADDVMAEVFRRHHPSVLAYARTCCRDLSTAQDLAAEAFARTYRAIAWGTGPEYAWRPYLLTCVPRLAAAWMREGARTRLSDDFEEWAAELSDGRGAEETAFATEEASLVLRAYRSLPERWQAVLWHSVVEGEPAAETAARLGISAGGVGSLAARAREGLKEAYLRAHLDQSASDECKHYGGQIAARLRRPGRRLTRDLGRHLQGCDDCVRAERDLRDINGRPGALLLGCILLWKPTSFSATLGENGARLAAETLNGTRPAGVKGGAMKWGAALAVVGAAVTAVVALLPAEAEHNRSDRSTPPTSTTSAPSATPSGPVATAAPAVVIGTPPSATAPASPTAAPRPATSAPTTESTAPDPSPSPTARVRRSPRGSDSESTAPSPEPESEGGGLGVGVG